MGRISGVKKLSVDSHMVVDDCIRRHRFVDLVAIRDDLLKSGIVISKSSLQRYMHKFSVRDGLHIGTPDDTMVIIVERSSGAMTSLTTKVKREDIVTLIGNLKAPD